MGENKNLLKALIEKREALDNVDDIIVEFFDFSEIDTLPIIPDCEEEEDDDEDGFHVEFN